VGDINYGLTAAASPEAREVSMKWQIAAVICGLMTTASAAQAEEQRFSAVDVRTSVPIAWVRRPSGEDMQRYYPPNALQQRLEGRATIACSVDLRGKFHDCLVVAERPRGQGFGDAAARMAPLYKVRMGNSADGAPIQPATPVTFEVRFSPQPSSDG
jgi:hypothetical protein